MPSIDLDKQDTWNHHRSGWKFALDSIRCLHNPYGIRFEGYLDGLLASNKIIDKPWVGVMHNTPEHPDCYSHMHIKGLRDSILRHSWDVNSRNCCGIYTLCNYTANFLRPMINVPVESLIHPTGDPDKRFNWDYFQANDRKMTLLIGAWMRRFESLSQVKSPFQKTALQIKLTCILTDDVVLLPWVDHGTYDEYLSKNIAFLDLYDVAACNTILDCMIRHTPLIIRRLPGAEEYLGVDYPGFYDDLDVAGDMLHDNHRLFLIHQYLANRPKWLYSGGHFLAQMRESPIYKSLGTVSLL